MRCQQHQQTGTNLSSSLHPPLHRLECLAICYLQALGAHPAVLSDHSPAALQPAVALSGILEESGSLHAAGVLLPHEMTKLRSALLRAVAASLVSH